MREENILQIVRWLTQYGSFRMNIFVFAGYM